MNGWSSSRRRANRTNSKVKRPAFLDATGPSNNVQELLVRQKMRQGRGQPTHETKEDDYEEDSLTQTYQPYHHKLDLQSSSLESNGSHTSTSTQWSPGLLPDGVLHLRVYQARQLAVRPLFSAMYERYGLHLRCYLAWLDEYVSDVYESQRNYRGDMRNPRWRRKKDEARDRIRGHFCLFIGANIGPTEMPLPVDTELVIEIVCGILVVATARVSLQEYFQTSHCSPLPQRDEDNKDGYGDDVSLRLGPHWYPLMGDDAGLIEMALEFQPLKRRRSDDTASQLSARSSEDCAYNKIENSDRTISFYRDDQVIQEAQNAFERERECEIIDKQRKMWFDDPEPTEKHVKMLPGREVSSPSRNNNYQVEFNINSEENNDCNGEDSSHSDILVANNGKTTMYIPQKRRISTDSAPIQSTTSSVLTALDATSPSKSSNNSMDDTAPVPGLLPPPSSRLRFTPTTEEQLLDEQLWELYYFGIANDQILSKRMSSTSSSSASSFINPHLSSQDARESSILSRLSRFTDFSEERSEASIISRKASTCASEVLTYNDRIQELESSLQLASCNQTQENQQQQQQESPDRVGSLARKSALPPHLWLKEVAQLDASRTKEEEHPVSDYASHASDSSQDSRSTKTEDAKFQETSAKGIVLFDPMCIPEKYRHSFVEKRNSKTATTCTNTNNNTKTINNHFKQLFTGRRRSLPVNSLSAIPPPRPGLLKKSISTDGKRIHIYRHPGAIDEEDEDEIDVVDLAGEVVAQRQRRKTSLQPQTELNKPNPHKINQNSCKERMRSRSNESAGSGIILLETGSTSSTGSAENTATYTTTGAAVGSASLPVISGGPRRNSHGTTNCININGSLLGIGKFINVGNVPGVVRYIGPTHFASGTWIGIELCEKKGKNNGTVNGVEYFTCASNHGIFIRASRLDIST